MNQKEIMNALLEIQTEAHSVYWRAKDLLEKIDNEGV